MKKKESRDPRARWDKTFVVLLLQTTLKKKKSLFGMPSKFDPSA